MDSLFEQASRLKIRFPTNVGLLTVEDLWDLPLAHINRVSLDDVAKFLHRAIKDSEEESFVVKATSVNEKLQIAFDTVKHIITVKLAEKEAAALAATNREKKQKLLSLLAEKNDEQLKGSSVEELQAMIQAL